MLLAPAHGWCGIPRRRGLPEPSARFNHTCDDALRQDAADAIGNCISDGSSHALWIKADDSTVEFAGCLHRL